MTTFAHISDTHIRNLKYHDEYRIVFKEIYDQLHQDQPDYIIHTGDMAHTKTHLSPEYFELTSEFLKNLADIAPTYIILGNHDGNLKNESRQDAVTPIIEALQHPNLHLLKDSGETQLTDSICLNVLSVFDRDNWVSPSDKSKVNIALYHGAIMGCQVSDGWALENGEDEVDIFKDFDFAMLGDIHRTQYLDEEKRVWYAGSTVQQNFGESLRKGYLLWNIRDKDKFSIEKRLFVSPRPFYTVEINKDGTLPKIDVPKNARLRLVSNYNLPLVKLRRACDYANLKWHPYSVNFVNKAGYSHQDTVEADGERINMRDQNTQEKYIKAFLSDKEISPEVLDRVLELNRKYSKQIEGSEEVSRNIVWKLRKMKWNNLFNYGEKNEIDFDKLNGLVGIFGKNYSGKSSIIDAALFGLFNATSKGERKNVHIINQNKQKAKCQLQIGVGDDTYEITRNLEKYEKTSKGAKSNEAKTELDFTRYALGEHFESKNGTTRTETDKNIQKTFGTFSDFLITSMASQTDAFGFINEGSTKRKEILAKFLDLKMFEAKHKLAKKDSSEMKGVIKHLNSIDWRKKLQWSREALIEIKEEVADQTDLCEKHAARVNELGEERKTIQDQLDSVGTDWVDIDELKNNLLKKENSLSVASESVINGESRLKKLIALKIRLRSFIDGFDADSRQSQVEKHKVFLKDISIIERNIRSTKMEIANYQNKIDLLHDHEYDPDCQYCSNNQFVKEAEEATTLIEKSRDTLRGFEYDLGLTSEKKDAINIAYLNAELQDYELKTREVKTNEVQIQKIKAQIEANESKKALAEKEIEEINSKIDHYYENQEAYENLESLQRDLKAINSTISNKEKDISRCNKKVLSLMSEEGATRRQIEEAREKIRQIDDAEKDYIAYDLFSQAMHANGVSYQVIKSMLPIINAEISSILNSLVNFEVFFDNVGDRLEIYIKHPKYDPRPLSMGSGAEKTIASMAIRLALISVTNLPKSELFILDEPATALDEEHMEGFIRLLQMIKGQFKTVLLISHLESLKDIVDMTIDIQKVDGYAKVKI
jgi:DNA repair exonuclease SbcCD ATPase subunit/DNA repair exonuclease SbcCD nuclease subunit